MAGELDRGYGDEPDRTVVAGNKLLVKDFGPARAAVRLCEQRLSSRRILGDRLLLPRTGCIWCDRSVSIK
jgi:hypothetical protein